MKESKFQIQSQTFRTMKSIEERKGKNEKKKIAQAIRIFHQIKRLSNTERGLLFQAIR